MVISVKTIAICGVLLSLCLLIVCCKSPLCCDWLLKKRPGVCSIWKHRCYGLQIERHVSFKCCAAGFETHFLLFGGCASGVTQSVVACVHPPEQQMVTHLLPLQLPDATSWLQISANINMSAHMCCPKMRQDFSLKQSFITCSPWGMAKNVCSEVTVTFDHQIKISLEGIINHQKTPCALAIGQMFILNIGIIDPKFHSCSS